MACIGPEESTNSNCPDPSLRAVSHSMAAGSNPAEQATKTQLKRGVAPHLRGAVALMGPGPCSCPVPARTTGPSRHPTAPARRAAQSPALSPPGTQCQPDPTSLSTATLPHRSDGRRSRHTPLPLQDTNTCGGLSSPMNTAGSGAIISGLLGKTYGRLRFLSLPWRNRALSSGAQREGLDPRR